MQRQLYIEAQTTLDIFRFTVFFHQCFNQISLKVVKFCLIILFHPIRKDFIEKKLNICGPFKGQCLQHLKKKELKVFLFAKNIFLKNIIFLSLHRKQFKYLDIFYMFPTGSVMTHNIYNFKKP